MEIKINFRWLILASLVFAIIGGCRAPENAGKPTEDQQPEAASGAPTEDIRPATDDKRPTTIGEGLPTAEKTLPPPSAEALATPYARQPAAGICGGPFEGNLAPVEIWPDVPSPRCLKITRDQRLQVTNQTDTRVTFLLGTMEFELPMGEAITLEAPLGSFLAPGVHVLQAEPFFGPELWLEE